MITTLKYNLHYTAITIVFTLHTELRNEGRVGAVSEVVKRDQQVKVKVLSFTGTKTSLSIKDVDQATGTDLNPNRSVK